MTLKSPFDIMASEAIAVAGADRVGRYLKDILTVSAEVNEEKVARNEARVGDDHQKNPSIPISLIRS